MKKLAILILLAMASCLQAEDQSVTQVFQLKYADPRALSRVLSLYGRIESDIALGALTITTRDNTVMSGVAQIIKQFDVPPPPVQNIDVTIYLMSALATPSTGPVPPDLEAAVKRRQPTSSYTGHQFINK